MSGNKRITELCKPTRAPLPLGTKISPFGKIAAVGMKDGERWYGFEWSRSIMPGSIVESMYDEQRERI